jgi:hypothetical protein
MTVNSIFEWRIHTRQGSLLTHNNWNGLESLNLIHFHSLHVLIYVSFWVNILKNFCLFVSEDSRYNIYIENKTHIQSHDTELTTFTITTLSIMTFSIKRKMRHCAFWQSIGMLTVWFMLSALYAEVSLCRMSFCWVS